MRKQLFIEKIMPVKLLNEQVYYEHGGNPFKGLHRWYSRKPLSFSRASVLASLLPADISMEEFLYIMGIYSQEEIEFWEKSAKTEEEKDKLRNIKEIRLYKQPPTQKQIERLKHHCLNIWGNENPAILDAFAGGGSIPFEGVRYGLNVFASDLNPVAVITMKAGMEYPLKFGKDLQQDIDKWVNYVAKEAEIRLAEFFPSTIPPLTKGGLGGDQTLAKGDLGGSHSAIASSPSSNTTKANLGGSNQGSMIPPSPPSKGGSNIETVQNYLWAHTVTCPHCHSTIPLSPNWWLYKRPEKQNLHKWCAVKPIPNLAEKRVDFELIKGRKGKGNTINNVQCTINNEKSINDAKSEVKSNNPDHVIASETKQSQVIEFDPNDYNTIGRGVGKCCNCGNVIEDDYIKQQAQTTGLGHQLYAVAFKQGKGSLEFRIPNQTDLEGVKKAEDFLQAKSDEYHLNQLIPDLVINDGEKTRELLRIGIDKWYKLFNPRQLLTLVTYVEIINDAKGKIQAEYEPEKAEAIITYLALVFDRCVDKNCRLAHVNVTRITIESASATHALNLMWNYPEINGSNRLWFWCAEQLADEFTKLCEYINQKTSFAMNFKANKNRQINLTDNLNNGENNQQLSLDNDNYKPRNSLRGESETKQGELSLFPEITTEKVPLFNGDLGGSKQGEMIPPSPPCEGGSNTEKVSLFKGDLGGSNIKINLESADSLYHLPDKSLEAIITDPPYYGTIQYAELSDFFYVWNKRILGDIFPDIFYQELTDKDREAVANPSRFRNMGISADELAKQDYEAKMAMAWNEAYRVLKDDGVLTVQFNHKESGAWDVLAKALIDAGFEITASWAVSTENPQNLHQAKKNSVSSTVILVCRKRQQVPLTKGDLGDQVKGMRSPLAPLHKGGIKKSSLLRGI